MIDRFYREHIRRSKRPVVLGPWRTEVGFEVLYHLPFMAWLLKGVEQKRVYVITRGGAGVWYPVNPNKTVDLYKIRPVGEVRRQTSLDIVRYKAMKHYRVSKWDREVITQSCGLWGIENPIVVHPSLTYRHFDGWFKGSDSIMATLKRLSLHPLPKPPNPVSGLPEKYYVSHFYARSTLQPKPELMRFIHSTLSGLSARAPVIQLQSPHAIDDHVDLNIKHEKVLMANPVDAPLTPDQTLAHNGAIIAGSAGFVGTYGGMAQVALRYGVPSMSFYDTLEGTSPQHLVLSQAISNITGVPFHTFKTGDIGLFSHVWKELSS
jgi:DNA-binding phage protein